MAGSRTLPLGTIKPRGWLRRQLRDDLQAGFASRLDRLTERVGTDLFTDRIGTSQEQRSWWDAETRGNWLLGYTMMAYLAGDRQHMRRVNSLVSELLATQDPDGYVGIYGSEWRYRHPPGENGELWAQSRALLVLLAYAELTRRDDVLEAVVKAVDLTMSHYGPNRGYYLQSDDPYDEMVGLTHGLNYVDALASLERLTGDARYGAFAAWLYEDFNTMRIPFPNDDLALRNVLQPNRAFQGHAPHTAEHLRVLLHVANVTGRSDHAHAVEQGLRKIRLYSTASGALIGDEAIHGLPSASIGYEYCTMTEGLKSLLVGLDLCGDAWIGDAVERLGFNAAQGARLNDGRALSYITTDTRLWATAGRHDSYTLIDGDAPGRFKLSPTHEDKAVCCNVNSMRLLPDLISHLWLRSPDERGLVAALYGPCVVEVDVGGVQVSICEETSYPFDDELTIKVHPASPIAFPISLRRPAWADQMDVKCPRAVMREADGYVIVEKTWADGDEVFVRFATTIRLEPDHTGEFSVHYAALQFVLPIRHRMSATKTYSLEGFHDYDVLPVDLHDAYRPLILDSREISVALRLQQDPAAHPEIPWETVPRSLVHGSQRLVPLGSTVLRRAAFPVTDG